MFARRLMGSRHLFAQPDVPLAPFHLIVGGTGFVHVGSVDGLPSFTYSAKNNAAVYPRVSDDEIAFAYRDGQYNYVKMLPSAFDGTLPPPIFSRFSFYNTPLRNTILSYSNNDTAISRIDWSGAEQSSISLAASGMTTGSRGLLSSSGRYACRLERAESTAATYNDMKVESRTSHYTSPFKRLILPVDLTARGSVNPKIALLISDNGLVSTLSFNDLTASLFSPITPSGGSALPISQERKRFVEVARHQAKDAIFALVQVTFEQVRCSGTFQRIDWPSYPGSTSIRYHYKTRAAYAKKTSLAIIRIADTTISIERVLCSGQTQFPAGDYAYHKAGRENGVLRPAEIEWTRPTTSDYFRDTNTANNFGVQDEVSPSEYLQQFDAIHAPGDPVVSWSTGEQMTPLIDNVPLLSPFLMSLTSVADVSFPYKLAFDGTNFFVFMTFGAALNGQVVQPLYKITASGAELIRSAQLTANSASTAINVFEAFKQPEVIYAGNSATGFHMKTDGTVHSFPSSNTARFLDISGASLLQIK